MSDKNLLSDMKIAFIKAALSMAAVAAVLDPTVKRGKHVHE
jgi:hypothetical protein